MNIQKLTISTLLFTCCLVCLAQGNANNDPKYLAGAVPVKNGYVVFEKSYKVNMASEEAFNKMADFVQHTLVEGENHLEQARITELNPEEGIIAASIEETLYFKKSAFVTHSTRFFYQFIVRVSEGQVNVEMRRLHYLYDESASNLQDVQPIPAEKWITDEEALNKKQTKLLRVPGKFRRFTIDRKDEIFRGVAKTLGVKTKKLIAVEE